MTALDLLDELAARGVTVIPDGNRLRLRPASALPPELVAAVRAAKPEILTVLRRGQHAPVSPWPPALEGLGPRTVGPFTPCLLCPTGTWARFGALPLCVAHARAWTETRGTPARAREMLWALLDLWATLDKTVWTAAEVMMLKNQIIAFWSERSEAETWWREWRAAHPDARLV